MGMFENFSGAGLNTILTAMGFDPKKFIAYLESSRKSIVDVLQSIDARLARIESEQASQRVILESLNQARQIQVTSAPISTDVLSKEFTESDLELAYQDVSQRSAPIDKVSIGGLT